MGVPNPLRKLSDSIASKSVVSVRGAIAGLAGILLTLVAWLENDLAASVLGPTLIWLSLIAALLSFYAGRKSARGINIALAIRPLESTTRSPSASSTLKSSTRVTAEISVANCSIPATFAMNITPVFTDGDNVLEALSIRSSGNHQTFGEFPHRGNWEFLGARTLLTDPLTVSEYSGFAAPQTPLFFRVEPLETLYPWSIISSVERAGDTTQVSTERLGSRLDLKTYHPADGMRSIAWKIFARRGELLARHPEAASTPEGTVILFSGATTEQDSVAGAAVAYARRCEEVGSVVVSGVLGSNDVATTAEELLNITIDAAFNAKTDRITSDFAAFIEAVVNRSPGGIVRKIAIAISEFVTPEYAAALKTCSAMANNANIALTLLIIPKDKSATHQNEHLSGFFRWFFEPATQDGEKSIHNNVTENGAPLNRAGNLGIEVGGER